MKLGDDGVARMGGVGEGAHWSSIHDAVGEARNRVLKFLGSAAAIDSDKRLSESGRAEKKREAASAALAALEKSGALEKARASVAKQVAAWDKALTPPKPDASTAMLHCEIRAFLASLKSGERVAFINSNLEAEVANAVLSAPAFLQRLEPSRIKYREESRRNARKSGGRRGQKRHTERAGRYRKRLAQCRQDYHGGGGLEKSHDGAQEVEEV